MLTASEIGQTSFTITASGLTPGTTYVVVVGGEESEVTTLPPDPPPAPSAPQNLRMVEAFFDRITFEADPVPGADLYRLLYNINGGPVMPSDSATPNWEVANLNANSLVYCSCRALTSNPFQESEPSNYVSSWTKILKPVIASVLCEPSTVTVKMNSGQPGPTGPQGQWVLNILQNGQVFSGPHYFGPQYTDLQPTTLTLSPNTEYAASVHIQEPDNQWVTGEADVWVFQAGDSV